MPTSDRLVTVTYKHHNAVFAGVAFMRRKGWQVVTTRTVRPWPARAHVLSYVVTYKRSEAGNG